MSHTPGQWVAIQGIEDESDRWGVFTASSPHFHIVTIENGAPGDCLDTEAANARLIAAAPDLLAALKGILTGGNHLALQMTNAFGEHPSHEATPEAAREFYKVGVPGWDGQAWKYDVWICWKQIMLARPALAKAEGKDTP